MNKTLFMLAVSVVSLGLVVSYSYAAGTTGRSGFMMFDSSNLVGATVKDSHGEFLGIVQEVRVDSGGHSIAVVNHGDYDLYGEGGVNTPVPFEALQISKTTSGEMNVVFKKDAEHFDYAPYLDPTQMNNRQYEANIYEYYGIQPYWTENGAEGTIGKNPFMELNSQDLFGAGVVNSCGKVIGMVNEVMVDSEGHAFAVINHGDSDLYGESGVNTPVPLQELRISQSKDGWYDVSLKTDTEHLDAAPFLNPLQTHSRQYETNIYEYYGIAPYWTQSGKLSK